ncbi:MAG: hypothetical protein E4G93_02575 [Dehalococcoidia bacterium]|nr:MAG: hypothetical protein E4G93_02575 [Dehalococcoidia bacterium]
MGETRLWGLGTKVIIAEFEPPYRNRYLLDIQATDTDEDVEQFLGGGLDPTYIISPDAGKSRENSITAHNIRRLAGTGIPIIVTIRGTTTRERKEFLGWLVENDYIPAFPKFSSQEDQFPLPRWRLFNEVRAELESIGEWIYACTDWPGADSQDAASLATLPGQWELIQ